MYNLYMIATFHQNIEMIYYNDYITYAPSTLITYDGVNR